MGAIPNKLPGFQDIEQDHEARARIGALWGTTIQPTYGLNLTQMLHAMSRRELTALFVIGENPGAVRRRRASRRGRARAASTISSCRRSCSRSTAELAHVVLPAAATWCEGEGTVTNSERRVQRVRKAVEPPAGARDELWIIVARSRSGSATTGARRRPKTVWNEFRVVAPHFAGGMSYARLEALGGIQWPCPGRIASRARRSCTDACGRVPRGGRAGAVQRRASRSAGRTAGRGVSRSLLTTGRRLESYNTGVQTSGYDSPLHFGETLDISPEDAARLGIADGDIGRDRLAPRAASTRRRASTPRSAPGMVFMTLHFPDDVATNLLTIDVSDPKSGTAEFKACAVRVEPRAASRRSSACDAGIARRGATDGHLAR